MAEQEPQHSAVFQPTEPLGACQEPTAPAQQAGEHQTGFINSIKSIDRIPSEHFNQNTLAFLTESVPLEIPPAVLFSALGPPT